MSTVPTRRPSLGKTSSPSPWRRCARGRRGRAGRCRRRAGSGAGREVGRWPRRVGQVEQLAAALVPEDAQAPAEALRDVAQRASGSTRSSCPPPWPDRRRPGSAGSCLPASSPPRGAGRARSPPASTWGARSGPRLRAAAPARARSGTGRRRSRDRAIAVRPPLLQESGDLGAGRGSFSSSARPAAAISRVFAPASFLPEVPVQEPLQHGPHHGIAGEIVAGGDEMERPAHERRAHRAPFRDQADELRRDGRPGAARTARCRASSGPGPAGRPGARSPPAGESFARRSRS